MLIVGRDKTKKLLEKIADYYQFDRGIPNLDLISKCCHVPTHQANADQIVK